ncbi:MAG: PD40 domain-containing protein [Saprospiraceae bacterium]|nr:PD40 domain-containing protein [Saprospiraceae bacterium]
MKNLKYFLGFTCLVLWMGCNTSAALQKGDTAYGRLEYQKAIDYYEKGLKSDQNPQAMVQLADSYRLTDQYDKAVYWYGQAVEQPQVDPQVKYYYATMLLATGNTEEAATWAEAYTIARPDDSKGQALLESIQNQELLTKSKLSYDIYGVAFNSENSDYAPMFWNGELIFVTDREGKTDPWTGRSYHALYSTQNGMLDAKALPGNLGGAYHNGAASISADGKTMYFTRSQARKEKGRDDVVRLSIYQAHLENGQWIEGAPFPYNSSEFSNLHPSISPDGKLLIFASDRDGLGGRDLFVCRDQGGRWGPPENLGAPVNSSGNECYPFLANDGNLYFASDGLPGLGGYDLFVSSYENGFWTSPRNLGGEINSNKDDIALITADGLNSGYFASNRASGNGTDDIFQFSRKKGSINLNGIVVDEFTSIPLPNVAVTAINQLTGMKQTFTTSNDGRFSFSLDADAKYIVSGILHEINTTRETVLTFEVPEDEPLFVKLTHNDPRFSLNGKALNRTTQLPVEGAKVKLYNVTKDEEHVAYSDAEGNFSFQLTQQSDFQISGEKDGYFTSIQEATTKGLDRSTTLFVKLYLTIEEIIIGKEITLDGGTIGNVNFENILYDFDKSNIRKDAAVELDKLVKILQSNPTIVIELGSHTDSRGEDDYNMKLSQARAESAVKYIISKGISAGRITAKGYGESRLANHCQDGVRCSEEDHQMNRRTEIKILKF